jgi:hypothetical protein
MLRRLAALEVADVELPPELRQWLGEPITDADRAAIVPAVLLLPAEQEAVLRDLPAELREWFGNRLYPAT